VSTDEQHFDAQATVSNHFAWMRTQLGLQRTLMAAVRTAVSLIGFGFTVAQFFQRMQGEAAERFGVELPRNLGLALITAGVVSLAVFTWEFHSAIAYLHSDEFKAIENRRPMRNASYLVAFVVMGIGLAAFVSVFLHF
jgi:putative membrane protein